MIKSMVLVWLCVPTILFSSGCASFRVLTDLKPEADATLQSPAGRFYIAGLKCTANGKDYDIATRPADHTLVAKERRLLTLIHTECLARYPLLFTKDTSDSVPLWITLDDLVVSRGDRMEWFFGTLFMAPYFLPLPTDRERDMTVAIGTGANKEGFSNVALRQSFHRSEHGWFSMFTPLGLISIPGASDFSKVSAAFNSEGDDICDMFPQLAQQVATAIAKQVVTKDAEFWTTQPRQLNSSVLSPGHPVNPPVALPLPTETVTPF